MTGLIRLALFMLFLIAVFAATMWIYFNSALPPKKSPQDTSMLVSPHAVTYSPHATKAHHISTESASHTTA